MNDAAPIIRPADAREPGVIALLEHHWRYTSAHSPPESVHALDLDALCRDDVTFWMISANANPLGCIALKHLAPDHGEIKSMHVLESARGRGLAQKLVEHVIAEARERSYSRLSLETGSMDAYLPARTLYESFGFTVCPPFAEYWDDPLSVCMTKRLSPLTPAPSPPSSSAKTGTPRALRGGRRV